MPFFDVMIVIFIFVEVLLTVHTCRLDDFKGDLDDFDDLDVGGRKMLDRVR